MTPPSGQPQLLEVASRAELRAWLAANHATSPGVLLAIGKKGNTVTALTYDDAVEEGLAFGWIDSTARKLDEHRYTVLFTPRKPGSVWAKSNKERVDRLVAQGLMAPAGLAIVEAAQTDGSWDLLNGVDDLLVPGDLADALEQHAAAEAFAAQSATQRRMSLYWIASAKRPATREKRLTEVARAAAEGRKLW
jgi:uncharacterized protein YdeI (YjbR/CyaY-like superfamily)